MRHDGGDVLVEVILVGAQGRGRVGDRLEGRRVREEGIQMVDRVIVGWRGQSACGSKCTRDWWGVPASRDGAGIEAGRAVLF